MSVPIYECLSPCFRGPTKIGNKEQIAAFFSAILDYLKQLFTSPIGQFDLIDLAMVAAMAFMVVWLLRR